MFWIASGFIALVISYDAAAAILISHAFPPALVAPVTIWTSLMDMTIGVLIAFRRTCAAGLIAGIAGLHAGGGDPDAGSVDRAARRAGQDRPGDRPDGGGAADAG
jgi:DoxX-like family